MNLIGDDASEEYSDLIRDHKTGGSSRNIPTNIPAHIPADAPKDKVVAELIPENASECAIWLQTAPVCSSDKAVALIARAVGTDGTPAEIIDTAKTKLSCTTEKCVLTKAGIDAQLVRGELAMRFKRDGPLSPALLSNVDIDSVMQQYSAAFPEFYPYNFNMRDYAKFSFKSGRVLHEPDSLATVQFESLYRRGIRCCGCIINSDVYAGPGKHWMALFADARGPKWTVEFFNSSGNPPAAEWINWMEKTRGQMETIIREEKLSISDPKIVKVSSMRHQDSKSECGVYSLFYVWARLNNVSHEYFGSTRVYDQHMFEFRRHLFEDSTDRSHGPFVWKEYTAKYETKWEKP